MPDLLVDLDGTRRPLVALDDTMSLGDLLERVRMTFDISAGDFHKYRLLAWPVVGDGVGAPDIKNLVEPSKPLGSVREEFGIAWDSTLVLEKVLG